MWRRLLVAVAAVNFLCGGPRAQARLGEPETSIDSDRSRMNGKPVLKTIRDHYVAHETGNSAHLLRQFVGKKHGFVFALAWKGVSPPVALESLTGKYYAEYAQAFRQASARPKGPLRVRVLHLETEHLIIERAGHGRALSGRVFVKDLLPADVKRDEIN